MNRKTTIEAALDKGEPLVIFTVGDSMEPLLRNRETLVAIQKVNGSLAIGQLPLYKRPYSGEYVLHRIVWVKRDAYYTRGDNRFGMEKVPKEWVLGIVKEISRDGKTIQVTDFRYKLYVFFRLAFYPVRLGWHKFQKRILKR